MFECEKIHCFPVTSLEPWPTVTVARCLTDNICLTSDNNAHWNVSYDDENLILQHRSANEIKDKYKMKELYRELSNCQKEKKHTEVNFFVPTAEAMPTSISMTS